MKKQLIALATLVALITLWPSLALAADEPPLNAAQEVALLVVQVLGVVLLGLATWGTRKLIKWIEAKTSVELSAEMEAKAENVVRKAVAYAEQKAEKLAKSQAKKLTGPEKLEEAAAFGIKLAKAQGLDQWLVDYIEDLIEAQLGEEKRAAKALAGPLPVAEGA